MLSKNDIETTLELGLTLEETAKILGCHVQTLRKYMRKYDIFSSYIPKSNGVRKLSLNEEYFYKIDSEKKAYFLGLLFSDGWVTHKTLGIRLIESDSEIIFAMKEDMESGHKVYKKDGKGLRKNQMGIEFCSIKMVKSLERYGLYQKKSHTLKINFDSIPEVYHRDILRGVFDGDGSFCNNQPCIATSSKAFKDQIVDKCFKYTGIKPYVNCQGKSNYRVYFRKNNFPFVCYIYLGSSIGICRKADSFNKLYNLWK